MSANAISTHTYAYHVRSRFVFVVPEIGLEAGNEKRPVIRLRSLALQFLSRHEIISETQSGLEDY